MISEFIDGVTRATATALLTEGFSAYVYRAASASYEAVGAEQAMESVSDAIQIQRSRCIRVLFVDTGERTLAALEFQGR